MFHPALRLPVQGPVPPPPTSCFGKICTTLRNKLGHATSPVESLKNTYHTALLLHAPHGGSKLEELCRSKHHHLWVAMPSQTHQISTVLNRIISGLCYVFERILGLKTTNRPQELWGLLPSEIQFSTICTFDTYLWNRGQAYFKNKYEI